MALRRQRVPVRWVLDDALELANPVLQPRRTRVDIRILPDELTFVVDPVRLAQAFANLLRNASMFSDVGAEVVVDVSARDGTVHIQVRDRGIGSSPGQLDQLSEPCARSSTPTGRPGPGLGLATAKSIVEMHGGSVALRRVGIGNGTEVIVGLPSGGDGDAVGSRRNAAT